METAFQGPVRSELEKKIEEALISLSGNHRVKISFVKRESNSKDVHRLGPKEPLPTTHAYKEGKKVILVLVEPTPGASYESELNLWLYHIDNAKKILDAIEQELRWRFSNPNFIEAIRDRIEYLNPQSECSPCNNNY